MPKKETESVRKSKRHSNLEKPNVKTDPEFSDSNASEEIRQDSKSPRQSKFAAKRGAVNMEDDTGPQMDLNGEISHRLETFKSGMNKMLAAKRKRLEHCAQEVVLTTTKKILEATKLQTSDRKTVVETFHNHMSSLIEQEETDMQAANEIGDKFQELKTQELKHRNQLSESCNNHLKALKALADQFCKAMESLENYHQQQFNSVNKELEEQMMAFQKKNL